MEFYDLFVFILKAAFVVIVILSIAIGVIWPLYQAFSKQTPQRNTQSPVHRARPVHHWFTVEEEEIEIPTPPQGEEDPNRKIIKMALEDPSKTTLLVRNWLSEKNR